MKGSKYAVLKLVESDNFLISINKMIEAKGASISEYDNWMPKGLRYDKEAELKVFLKHNFTLKLGEDILNWWLIHDATTPNWDLLSTCIINGERGLLLVEAKGHYDELDKSEKKLDKDASVKSKQNHDKVYKAIEQANCAINSQIDGVSISRDKCYQLSNRVAHAWWLAGQGIPVVLLYLGFLNCTDMEDGKRTLFMADSDWQECFTNHAKLVGVEKITEKWIDCGKSKFITICRSL